MAKTVNEKFFQVAEVRDYDWRRYDNLDSAIEKARAEAWKEGKDQAVMGVIAIARAPEAVNNVKVETLS